MCDLTGRVLRHWTMRERVNDLAFIPESNVIVCVTADRHIELMRLNDHVPVRLNSQLMSCNAGEGGQGKISLLRSASFQELSDLMSALSWC